MRKKHAVLGRRYLEALPGKARKTCGEDILRTPKWLNAAISEGIRTRTVN